MKLFYRRLLVHTNQPEDLEKTKKPAEGYTDSSIIIFSYLKIEVPDVETPIPTSGNDFTMQQQWSDRPKVITNSGADLFAETNALRIPANPKHIMKSQL